MTLTRPNAGDVTYPSVFNQFLYVLQQPSGGTDTGHYIIEYNSYANPVTGQAYIISRSRVSVPVSVTADNTDVATTNCTGVAVSHIFAGGFRAETSSTAIATNFHCGGAYTIQY